MVNIVENWEEMEAYSGQVKNGYYQIVGVDGIIELRIQLGRLGFIKEFKDANDPLLNRILELLQRQAILQCEQNRQRRPLLQIDNSEARKLPCELAS